MPVAVRVLIEVCSWSALNAAGKTAVEEALEKEDDITALMREEIDKTIRAGAAANPDHYWACIRVRRDREK